MIFKGSRYETVTPVPVSSSTGWVMTVFRWDISAPASRSALMLTSEHADMQQIAATAYGNAELWWRIADANPELLYPDRIPRGTVVRIPGVPTLR